MCDTFLTIVKNKITFLDYTAQNPKNTTEKLDITSELMQLSWPSLIEHINNSDDSVDLKDISANAFAFVEIMKILTAIIKIFTYCLVKIQF